MSWIPFIVAAYVLGSIPFGVLIARSKGVDITSHGSGNIGATNVGRVLGRRFGLVCFALDMAKGAAPVLAAGAWHGDLGYPATQIESVDMWLWLAVAAAALIGHMASIFLRFRGGKGVATAFGALLAVWPTLGIPALVALGVWILIMATVRIMSIASMIAAVSLPISVALLMQLDSNGQDLQSGIVAARSTPPLAIAGLIAVLVLVRHRSNIARLLKGREQRVGRS